jgi:hypothetical protein
MKKEIILSETGARRDFALTLPRLQEHINAQQRLADLQKLMDEVLAEKRKLETFPQTDVDVINGEFDTDQSMRNIHDFVTGQLPKLEGSEFLVSDAINDGVRYWRIPSWVDANDK